MKRLLIPCCLILLACQDRTEPQAVIVPPPQWKAAVWQADSLDAKTLAGSPVLLAYWATWCASCQSELPVLSALAAELKPRGLRILTINADQDPQAVLPNYMAQKKWDLPVLLPSPSLSSWMPMPDALPTLVLVDAQGKPVRKWIGPQTEHTLREAIEPLLKP